MALQPVHDDHQVFPPNNAAFLGEDGKITRVWWRFLYALWNRTGSAQPGSVNSGFISMWGGDSVPSGYLLCDGREVSRTTYASLFAAIGETWGEGDGTQTFNLPDLVGRFPRGASKNGGSGGEDEITLSVNQMPSHTHVVTDLGHVHSVTDPGHVHTAQASANNATAGAAQGSSPGNTGSATTGISIDSATTGISLANTGGSAPISLLPRYTSVMVIIKT